MASGDATTTPPSSATASPLGSGTEENDASQHDLFRKVAETVPFMARADGLYWSPYDCRAPPASPALVSKAPEASPHGQKLYTLAILDFAGYARDTARAGDRDAKGRGLDLDRVQRETGIEQAVVKVSYLPTDDRSKATHGIGSASVEGKTIFAGEPRELFVMVRPREPSRATDQGWLYGTISADGKQVTSAGKVASCMGCHEKAPHGRLFGLGQAIPTPEE